MNLEVKDNLVILILKDFSEKMKRFERKYDEKTFLHFGKTTGSILCKSSKLKGKLETRDVVYSLRCERGLIYYGINVSH